MVAKSPSSDPKPKKVPWTRCSDEMPHKSRVVWFWPGYGDPVPARVGSYFESLGKVFAQEIGDSGCHTQAPDEAFWSGDGWPDVPDFPALDEE